MKLWKGRFAKEENELANEFNSSVKFDKRLWHEDISGSIAHAKMLCKQGIISEKDCDSLVTHLKELLWDIEAGREYYESEDEDIHMFVERMLTKRAGNVGKKLHTARSRNDQVALDFRMYQKILIGNLDRELASVMKVLVALAKEHKETIMPGYTHLQKAQPVLFAHHLLAYYNMFSRDRERFSDCLKRTDYMPLGAGALAGTTYDTDRNYVAQELGFAHLCSNSMDAVSDRDFAIEFLSCCSTAMMHLSRLCEELIIWASPDFGYIEMDDSFSTGSSIMPQKKNPDIAELVRGKTGRVYGALMSLLTTMKGIPLAYNKDMQEDKELSFDAMDTVKGCIALFNGMLATMKFNGERMRASANGGFTNATDAADYLVNHGVPFRDAHGIVGQIVLYCIEKGIAIDDMSLEELKAISPVFEDDVYEAISMETCVNKRLTVGAPGKEAMEQVIAAEKKYLEEEWKPLETSIQ